MLSPSLTFKNLWFQQHWFIGITAGTVLIVIGLSGAVLSFHEEILDWANPGTASVPVRAAPALTPPQIAQALREAGEARPVQRIAVRAEAGRSARVTFAPPPGQRRGDAVFVDPYTGAVLPAQQGAAFFDWVESLHRWLLLPRSDGRTVTGTLAAGLLVLALSGLYLRWPRRPLSWRTWLTFDPALQGRSFLWGLHSVVGTWALVAYIVFAATGLYWAFDAVRAPVDRWAGVPARSAAMAPRPPAAVSARAADPTPSAPPATSAPPDLTAAWSAFERLAAGWRTADLRIPERAGQPLQISWLDADAAHERARNQLQLRPDGTVQRDERFADLPAGRRAVGAIYPLHMGTYFGLPGRIVMTLASLVMPLFAVTGWLLYLDRRRRARAVRGERAALAASAPAAGDAVAGGEGVLVAFASQSGRAERLAVRTAALLRGAGLAATLAPVATLGAEALRHHRRVLFIASTFGEGDPPDAARRFARTLATAQGAALAPVHYGLLALGDRHYAAFCGFGHALDHQLRRLGAQPLFPLIEMDGEAPAAWTAWLAALASHLNAPGLAASAEAASPALGDVGATATADWTLAGRTLCNAGSQGAPLFALQLTPPPAAATAAAAAAAEWKPGALVEVLPRHDGATLDALLQRNAWPGDAPVRWAGQMLSLREALARSVLPVPGAGPAPTAPDAGPPGAEVWQRLADTLQPLAPRSYSVASLPGDGHLALLVRQVRHDAGLGMASGWLTAHAPLGTPITLRLVENMAFAPAETGAGRDDRDAPAIFIGNGSGYAGLRGHLLARIRSGRYRNWLLFGERQRAFDAFCQAEAAGWLAAGQIARGDFVYSRDQPERRYVQDALRDAADLLRAWVQDGAVIYVCGSLQGMAAGVDAALAEVLGSNGLDDLIAAGRYRRDVY